MSSPRSHRGEALSPGQVDPTPQVIPLRPASPLYSHYQIQVRIKGSGLFRSVLTEVTSCITSWSEWLCIEPVAGTGDRQV